MKFPRTFNQNGLLSGMAQHRGEFYFGQNDIIQDVDFGESVGIFTLVSFKESEIKISQDFIGCGTLFYAELNGYSVVSNRYHLLLLVLSWNGFKGELNPAKIATTLYHSKTVFLEANISSQMDIRGVYQLPLHSEIIIDYRGFRIIDKQSVRKAFEGYSPSERKELMENAKSEVVKNITSVMESNRFSKIVTDLSGGMIAGQYLPLY